MKANIYVLGLFTFRDEEKQNKVFTDEELDEIKRNIDRIDGIDSDVKTKTNSRWEMYKLDASSIQEKIPNTKITSASMGYYHHRIIFRFQFVGKELEKDLRKIRKVITEYTDTLLKESIIKPNQAYGFKNFINTYQLITLQNRDYLKLIKEDPVFSNDTTTMTFDINEPRSILPIGKKYNIRISIPSTIITSNERVSNDFVKAMINAIYQSCLYEIKEKEWQPETEKAELTEDQLVKLWQHIIDTMGGRTLDKNIAKISQTNLIVAVAALALGLLSLTPIKNFIKLLFYFWYKR